MAAAAGKNSDVFERFRTFSDVSDVFGRFRQFSGFFKHFQQFWGVFPRFWTVLERLGSWFWHWKLPEETGISGDRYRETRLHSSTIFNWEGLLLAARD